MHVLHNTIGTYSCQDIACKLHFNNNCHKVTQMMKLSVMSVTKHMPSKVSDIVTLVTLNTINCVVNMWYGFL